jgi:hypothetical protein
MDGAIDPASAEQRGVSGIDDRIDIEPGDIAGKEPDAAMEVGVSHCTAFCPRLWLELLDRVSAKEPFFSNGSIPIIDGHLCRLIGFGQPHGFRNRLLAARISAARVIFALL